MRHLFICREYPPAAYLPGGIGTYVRQVCEGLARAGETVHVIGHRWAGAPCVRETLFDGRLTVHRVALDEPLRAPEGGAWMPPDGWVQRAMLEGRCPAQAFAWQAALLAERLVDDEGIDVIEAQEWEAPLIHLQWRRLAGLGPARRPPCIVHLHSSSEMIFRSNDWDTAVADHAASVAVEAATIRLADAVLAPSHFIARETAARLQVPLARIDVIPYPLQHADPAPRSAQVWATPAVCHVGRLELRKGVLEWAQAVGQVGRTHPALRAHLAGGDTPLKVTGEGSVKRRMRGLLPPSLRRHLVFHGNLDAQAMARLHAQCSLAVVPSRWENFPYSCMEAMRSGLPVIVAPNGGMVEMVSADHSGWIAADGTPDGLAAALRAALDTPPTRRQAMGEAAAARIRALCGPDVVLAAQLALRRRVVARAAVPQNLAPTAAQQLPARPPTVLCAPGLQGMPNLVAACAAIFARQPTCMLVVGRIQLEPGGALLLPDLGQPWRCMDDGRPQPLLVLAAPLAERLGLPAGSTQTWPHGGFAQQLETLMAGLPAEAVLVHPAVLGRLAADRTPAPVAALRWSAMALAVQRAHLPWRVWLARCTPGFRRALVHRAAGAAVRFGWRCLAHPPRPAAPVAPAPLRLPPPAHLDSLPPMQSGLVSVVVAAYNAASTLPATLASVMAQTYPHFELIVIDDGSSDSTPRIVEALAATDARVRLVSQRNAGVAAARNRGIRLARGEFLAPLDADDLWAPIRLERMVHALQLAGPDAGMAYCWWLVVDGQDVVLDRSPAWQVQGRVLRQLAEVNFVGSASVPMFRHSVLRCCGPQLGYDVRLRDLHAQGCEDWDLLLRVAQDHAVVCVPELLVAYRRHAGSMSSGCAAMWRSGQLVLDGLARRRPDLPRAVQRAGLGQFALHLAGVAFWTGRPLEALAWIARARAPATLLAILPALLRLLLGRTVGVGTPPPARLAVDPAGMAFEGSGLPAPLMPYERVFSRRWRRRGDARPKPAVERGA